MKSDNICYFVEDNAVKFGVYDYHSIGGHNVSLLCLPEYRKVNGIPIQDFESETEWKKLPKDWSYDTQLFEMTADYSEIPNETIDIRNRESIQRLFDNGILVRTPMFETRVEAEIDRHKGYRLVKRTLSHRQSNVKYFSKPDRVFETWEEAHTELLRIRDESEKLMVLTEIISFHEALEELSDRFGCSASVLEAVKQKLLELPRVHEIQVRYYRKTWLWQYRNEKEWKEVLV